MANATSELPATTIDPYKLCEQGAQLTGTLPLKTLGRASDLLVSDQGSITAVLTFGRDEERRQVIEGELDARIWVTCQRCLEPMEEHVRSRFQLALVTDDDGAKQVPSHYEPVLCGPGGGMKVREVVEDELLLAMAPFPMHPEDECDVDPNVFEQTDTEAALAEERRKPFEQLEGLFKGKKDDSSKH